MLQTNAEYISNLELINTIGSPFIPKRNIEYVDEEKINELYSSAKQNRIPLYFLDVLNNSDDLFFLKNIYIEAYERYLKIFDTMAKVSEYLTSMGIEYAIFKSIKPFPDASVDIDTIIFNTKEYVDLVKLFPKKGWPIIGYGPQSVTCYDAESDVGIDLYREIAVSSVIYVDKDKLKQHITEKLLPNNQKVYTLEYEADLLCTVAHSVIKEQMFTLAEYYTLLIWINEMNNNNLKNLQTLIEVHYMNQPFKSFITLVGLLHKKIFNFIPNKILYLTNYLNKEYLDENKFIKNDLYTPHKYHSLTVMKSIINKLKDKKTKNSIALQGYKMMKAKYTLEVIEGLIDHITRKTY